MKEFLNPEFEMISTVDDYIKTKKFVFCCRTAGHQNELTTASFTNKKCKVPLNEFCIGCVKENENQEHTKEYINTIKEKTGHTIIAVNFTTRKVTYQCGNCQTVSESFTHVILNINTGVCHNCQHWKFKLSYEKLKSDVESYGMKLVTLPEQYTGNKQLLDVMCECGKPYQMVLSSIRQDKKCSECKLRKYKETCLEKYGVENVMHVPEIFEHKQSSCYRRKIYKFPSGKEVVVMGYEPRAIQELIEEAITEEQFRFGKDIPTFYYPDNNSTHIYYPDLYIPHINLIVEVKSDYTLVCHLSKNRYKLIAVVEKGYQVRLMVYNDKIDKNNGMVSKEMDETFSSVEQINKWFDEFKPKECQINNIDRFQ